MAPVKVPFKARVVQYVHDAAAQERLNVGVILDSASYADGLFVTRLERVSAAFPGADLGGVRRVLKALRAAFDAKVMTDSTATAQEVLTAGFAAGIVLGDEIRGVTANAAQTLENLFDRLTIAPSKSRGGRSEDEVWREFVARFGSNSIPMTTQESAGVLSWTFKHVWQNGSANAIEVLSLDRQNPADIKQHAAQRMGLYRELAQENGSVKITLLVGEPREDVERQQAAVDGLSILQRHLGGSVEVFPENRAQELVDRVLRLAH
jgi:Protein of unknown function (DUF3037)